MINQEQKDICQWAMSKALDYGCQECKVNISMGHEKLIELRDGVLDQINHSTSCLLSIHLYVDGRYSVVTTNRLDREDLDVFISKSVINTRSLAEDVHRYLPPMELCYSNALYVDLKNYDSRYDDIDMESKLALARSSYSEMSAYQDVIISGTAMVDDYEGSSYTISSNGFEGENNGTSFALSCTTSVRGEGEDRPEGCYYDFSPMWDELPKTGIGLESALRATKKIGSRKIAEGEYAMIVENMAVSRLLSPVIGALKGNALQQEQSFLVGKKGEKVFGDMLTIIDNPLEIGNAGAQLFDSEGIALKEMRVINGGVIENYYISQYISRKMGCDATTAAPSVLKFRKGDESLPEMISRQKKAIFVTGFNGGNCNGTTGDFSYGIEGFLIENGVMTTPFSEMIVTGNMIELWNKLSGIADDALYKSSWQMASIEFESVQIS